MADWRRAREQQEHARTETMKQMRQKLGLSTTDKQIEKSAKERTDAAVRKAVRDAGEG